MYDFGIALGLAFQLQDDFLDTFGNPEVFGKQIGGDILNDKKTWLLINACARDKSGVLASALAGEYAPEEKIAKVREVYVALGLDREIRDVINDYARKAVECIEMTSMNTEWKTYFTDLAGSLTSREV